MLCLAFFVSLHSPFVVADENADDAPAKSELVVDETFDDDGEIAALEDWHVNTGGWQVSNGALRGDEIESEKHAAAVRRKILTENAVYQLRFRFGQDSRAFHFGFDPAKGELKKKGHLFSVIVARNKWTIMKHVDKNRPKEFPNEVLASEKGSFEDGRWYTLRVTTWGPFATAMIEGKQTLKVSDQTFAVKKPTLVFRVSGSDVEIDDLKVWKQTK